MLTSLFPILLIVNLFALVTAGKRSNAIWVSGSILICIVCIFLVGIVQSIFFIGVLLLSVSLGNILKKQETLVLQNFDMLIKKQENMLGEIGKQIDTKRNALVEMEKQMNNIINLFETAKYFNECLDMKSLLTVLRSKMREMLTFQTATLILLDDLFPKEAAFQVYQISEQEETQHFDSVDEPADSPRVEKLRTFIAKSHELKNILHLENKKEYQDVFGTQTPEKINFPLWLFPLVVEQKLIALWMVEGSPASEFGKFNIIASQLALQIKKIKLYLNVKELSITDGLTGVFLRRHFTKRFEEELRRSLKYHLHLCVLMIDIDHFKEYNDNYGHLVGDVTLKEVAKTIKENIRKVDLAGRYGGEEFILVLPETSKNGGMDAAERIRSAVAQRKLVVYDVESKVTLSIGLIAFPEDFPKYEDLPLQQLMEELIKLADRHLYQAKEDGRNQVGFRK